MPQSSENNATRVATSAAGMKIVKLLIGQPAKTVAELTEEADVTRTAVTEQLNELVAAGLVERSTERLSGRGRPRYVYQATEASLLLLFSESQRLLVPAIWEAIVRIGGAELKRKVLRRVSRTLAESYKSRIKGRTPSRRLRQLGKLLGEEGVLVDVIENGRRPVLEMLSCPFVNMFEETRAICCIDEEILKLIVGAPVKRVSHRHDGDPCCSFVVASSGRKKRYASRTT